MYKKINQRVARPVRTTFPRKSHSETLGHSGHDRDSGKNDACDKNKAFDQVDQGLLENWWWRDFLAAASTKIGELGDYNPWM